MARPIREIDVTSAAERLGEYRVIDVREADEFHGPLGHVAGSELLPLGRLEQSAHVLGQSRLLLVCRSGNRSGKACATLIELGVAGVTNLAGGMLAWNEAGLPVAGRRAE